MKGINYIILDDDLPESLPNLVKTSPEYGFNFKDYEKADAILKSK